MAALFSQVKNEKPYMVELYRHFHQFPEPSLKEFKTAEKIRIELAAMGIPYIKVGETGVLATIKGEALGKDGEAHPALGKIIVLRADIDALNIQEESDVSYSSQNNGVMHACGHDGHIASLLGAAKVLEANRGAFSGEVRLIFQQAEEVCVGARQFIAADALKGAGRVFATHMAPDMDAGKIDLTPGPRSASADYFRITVRGKSAHVSTPHKGNDALYAACQIVNALQGIATRRTSPMETVLIGVGTLKAGTAYNIIADEAVLEGTLRTFSAKLREELQNRINETSANIAAVSGTEREIIWEKFAPVLVNDTAACQETAEIAAAFAGKDAVLNDRRPSLGGDDFAEFLLSVPGVYANIGCGIHGKTRTPLHSKSFIIDEDALVYAAGMYACYAAWYLSGDFS
jgi:amidohydrolase